MIRATFWKEWREHRLKYGAYWTVLNLPILITALCIALNKGARTFADLTDATAAKYLGLAMVFECYAVVTVLMLVTGFLAVATFSSDLEDRSLFFLFEQPAERWKYPASKVLNGVVHIGAAIVFAVLFAPLLGWILMLAGGRVSVGGSVGTVETLMLAGLRGALWCWLVSAIVFTACALITAIWPRWWAATAGAVVVVIGLVAILWNYFDLFTPAFASLDNASVGVGFGNSQWLTVTITQALPLGGFPAWKPLPVTTALAVFALLAAATDWMVSRKELK